MPRDDGAWVPSPKPSVHPCPTQKVSGEEEEDKLRGSPSTDNAAQRSGILLAKEYAPAGAGTGVLRGLCPHKWPCTVPPPSLAQPTALNPRIF